MVQLFVKRLDRLIEVDLADDIQITLSKNFKDYKNVTSTNIPSSFNISIPNNLKNKDIFYDFQSRNSSGAGFNYKTVIEGELLLNSRVILRGMVQVLGYTYSTATIDLVIFNREFSVFKILKDEFISSIDFSDLDHEITATRIIQSWQGGLNSNKTIYPLADNGQGFGYNNPDNLGFKIDMTAGDPINPDLLVPAFQVTEIIGRILDDAVSRTNLQGWDFPNLPSNLYFYYNLKPTEAQLSPVDFVSTGTYQTNQLSIVKGTSVTLPIYQTSDPADMIKNNNITAIHDGNYKIDSRVLLLPSQGMDTLNNVFLDVYVNGIFHSNFIDFGRFESSEYNRSKTVSLTTGDVLTFKVRNDSGYSVFFFDNFDLTFTVTAQGTAGLPIAGGRIYTENFFKKIKKIDLIRELVKMYNLVVYIDDSNVLKFQIYDDWIAGGNIIDINGRVLEEGYKIVSPTTYLFKNLKFNYTEGKDYANVLFDRDNEFRYGSGELISDIPFLSETLDNTVRFSPFLRVQLQDNKRGATNLPDLYGIKNVSSPNNIDSPAYGQMYLVYYNGFRTGVTTYKIGASTTNLAPFFSHYSTNYASTIKTTDLDLNWFFTSPPAESGYTFASDFDPVNSNSLTNKYYKKYLELLYNDEVKILEIEMIMTQDNYNDIKANSRISYDGNIYTIIDLKYSVTALKAKLKLIKN